MSQKKFKAWFLNQGSKSECPNWRQKNLDLPRKLNYHIWKYYILKKIWFWPFYAIYGHFKTKICNISEKKCYQKKFYCAKKSLKKFLQHFRCSKKFRIFFCFFFFLQHPLYFNFFWTLLSLFIHTFWVTSQSDHKNGP